MLPNFIHVAKNKGAQQMADVSLCCKNREHHKLTGLSTSQDGEIIFAASEAKIGTFLSTWNIDWKWLRSDRKQ